MKIIKEGVKVRIIWKPNNRHDVNKARKLFTSFTRQGWLATINDGELKRILNFNPNTGEILFIPLIEGG